jgi:hypothetical protein
VRTSTSLTFATTILLLVMPVLASERACQDLPGSITACTQEEIEAIPTATYGNPNWFIQLTPSGYSDFVIRGVAPFPDRDPRDPDGPEPLHEMLSGELMAGIRYDGMFEWLERCLRYPDWESTSTFDIVQPVTFPEDADADGFLEGDSIVANDHLRIRVSYDFEDTGTGVAMGYGPLGGDPYRLSDRYVLRTRYELTNISGATLSGVSFYQLVHPHPANTEISTVDMAYDPTQHLDGALQGFRYDLTGTAMNSGLTDGYPTGSTFWDHVSLSADMAPAAFGLGPYRGHVPGDPGLPASGGLKPEVGIHCDVEANLFDSETSWMQDQSGGAMRWDFGDLAADETVSLTWVLAIQSEPSGVPAPACLHIEETGGDPRIRFSRGACPSGLAAGPYDLVVGSLADLALAPGCSPDFDCVQLTDLWCRGRAHGFDVYDADEDAHATDALYYLVRRSAAFTSWGMGRQPDGMPPLQRFFFSPSTAPDIDVCQAPP